jgi:hypothetical protein
MCSVRISWKNLQFQLFLLGVDGQLEVLVAEVILLLCFLLSYFSMLCDEVSVTPAGKKGLAAAANSQRVMSSPEDTPVPTPSPAPRRRGRPRKNPVMEHSTVEDESTLFCIIRNGKSSLQVETLDSSIIIVFSKN